MGVGPLPGQRTQQLSDWMHRVGERLVVGICAVVTPGSCSASCGGFLSLAL